MGMHGWDLAQQPLLGKSIMSIINLVNGRFSSGSTMRLLQKCMLVSLLC